MENIKSLRSRFTQLTSKQQTEFLLLASFNLTLEVRGLREIPDAELRTQALGINELQHKLLSQAIAELSGTPGYPGEVLIDIFFEIAENQGVFESAYASLDISFDKFNQ